MSVFQSREERGIHVHVLSTNKYRINTIVATLTQPLQEETATGLALIPYVMMRGSECYPTPEKLQLATDELYGASLSGVIDKKGERQVIDFTMQVPNEKFLATDEKLFQRALELLSNVMLHPLTVDGGFSPEYVQAEKEQQKKRINAMIDDKVAFARERLLQEMTKGEPYAIPRLGRIEELDALDPKALYEQYRQVLKTAPMHVYVIGDVELDEVADFIFRAFDFERAPQDQFAKVRSRHDVREVKEVVDRLDVNQGKLNLGFRTGIDATSDDWTALMVANGIFGSFPHSKLFMNVREKHSLAYYCSSRIDSNKGLLYVQAGVEPANFEKAIAIIKEQLEELKKGNVTDEEFSFTVNGLVNGYKTTLDSPTSAADIHLNGLIVGKIRTPDEVIENLGKVSVEDVVRVAQNITLDTVYMLRDKGGETNA